MIELKHVSKTYKSKKATNTIALKDISIKFPEKGMIFILGKSGSGKSTLLNVIGGLDKYDNGEVIINGKSTKEFKETDWDAYRNTYIGFIFQEFNLIEDYSVEQNINLALELQHKKGSDEEIEKILNMVDLAEISKRKTNELSGGQKQRVAIARALIKNPEIVIADEPTGNLDSSTGEQIWNILKNISKEKLVIVVSHDEESASKYADRTIKLQDGTIVSDDNPIDTEIKTNQFCLKKAKLPFYHSLNLAIKSMLTKKAGLLLNSIIIALCFVFFGITLSTSWSNLNERTLDLFEENTKTSVSLSKYSHVIDYEKNFPDDSDLQIIDDSTLAEIEQNTGLNWYKEYTIDSLDLCENTFDYIPLNNSNDIPVYYNPATSINSFKYVELEENNQIKNLIGSTPKSENEIVIPSYIADYMIYSGINAKISPNDNSETIVFKPTNYNDFINNDKYFKLCDSIYVKIVGIIDDSEELSKYSNFKTETYYDYQVKTDENELKKYNELVEFVDREESKVYVCEKFIDKLNKEKVNFARLSSKLLYNNENAYPTRIAYINKDTTIYTNNGAETINDLAENEIIITDDMLNAFCKYEYASNYYSTFNISYLDASTDNKSQYLVSYLKNHNIIGSTIDLNVKDGKIVTDSYSSYIIKGVIIGEQSFEYTNGLYAVTDDGNSETIYCSKNVVMPFIRNNAQLFNISTRISTKEDFSKVLEYCPILNSNLIVTSYYSDKVANAYAEARGFGIILKYATIVFAIFSAMILIDFVQKCVKSSKKKIGTLRALGCSSIDVIKIFLYESFSVMLLPLIISIIVLPILIRKLNLLMINFRIVEIDMLSFGLFNVLQLLGFMIIIVLLSNILLVGKTTKMKPIDAILNK